MDVKSLLESAAKAVGLYDEWPEPDYEVQCVEAGMWCSGMGTGRLWSPLFDDGDTLRNEMKLGLSCVEWADGAVEVGRLAVHPRGLRFDKETSAVERVEDHGGDTRKARRYASLRAAANIGKQKGGAQ